MLDTHEVCGSTPHRVSKDNITFLLLLFATTIRFCEPEAEPAGTLGVRKETGGRCHLPLPTSTTSQAALPTMLAKSARLSTSQGRQASDMSRIFGFFAAQRLFEFAAQHGPRKFRSSPSDLCAFNKIPRVCAQGTRRRSLHCPRVRQENLKKAPKSVSVR